MSLLDFNKPKKIRKTRDHNGMYQSDSGIAGTYVQNMSEDDKRVWKGKHITGGDERVEIRKTIDGVSIVLIVYKKTDTNNPHYYKRHNNIKLSMNGSLQMSWKHNNELQQAIDEAVEILNIKK